MQNRVLLSRIAEINQNPKTFIESHYHELDFNLIADTADKAELFLLIGRSYLLIGVHDMAIQLLSRALDYYEKSNFLLAHYHCYSYLGIIYREEKQFNLALNVMNKAYDLSFDLNDFKFVIQALINLSSVYSAFGDLDKAKEIIHKALEYKNKIENTKILGDLYNNYALIYLDEADYETALEYFSKSYSIYKNIYGDVAHPSIALVLGNIGENYLLLKEYQNAEKYLLKALMFARQIQMIFIEMECHTNLSKTFEAIGNYEMALKHYKLYNELDDQELAEQTKQEIENIKNRLEDESKKNREEINILRNVELKNKTEELEKTLKNLAQIGLIGQKLTSSMDLQQIYEILRNSVYELMHADIFGIALFNEEKEVLCYEYFEENGVPISRMEVSIHEKNSLGPYCIINEQDLYIKSFYEEYTQYIPSLDYLPLGISGDENKKSKCILYTRLIIEGRCIGLMTMQSYQINEYSDADFEVIKALASYVAIAISNAQKNNIIREKAVALEYLSYNDPLTELYNRRYFNELTKKYENDDASMPIGLIIGDMNELKLINDTFGHQVGDQYIMEISKIVKKNAEGNPVFRLGGDEFAILVESTSEPVLKSIISQILEDCNTVEIGPTPLSISMGYEIKHNASQSLNEIFSQAESLMYSEKRKVNQGRRRVIAMSDSK